MNLQWHSKHSLHLIGSNGRSLFHSLADNTSEGPVYNGAWQVNLLYFFFPPMSKDNQETQKDADFTDDFITVLNWMVNFGGYLLLW